MAHFVDDGYIYIMKRNEDDYVLAKDSAGKEAYDLPRNYALTPYSFDEAEQYWRDNPDKHFVEKEETPTEEELLERELSSLLMWFDHYDEQCMQYQRSLRMGISWDGDITQLDQEAVVNAQRINELRNLLA